MKEICNGSAGKIIVEIYEYTEDSSAIPRFEFIPCNLDNCIKKGKTITLKDIIETGFDDLPKKTQNAEKRREIMEKLEEADIGRITVAYHAPHKKNDPYIELTNITQVTMADADARRVHSNKNEIILYGRYRLTDGNETMKLRDSQRLTLIYSNTKDETWDPFVQDEKDTSESEKEICLNITYLQD